MITRAKISAVRANSFVAVEQLIVLFLGLINFFVPDAALIRVNTVFVIHY